MHAAGRQHVDVAGGAGAGAFEPMVDDVGRDYRAERRIRRAGIAGNCPRGGGAEDDGAAA